MARLEGLMIRLMAMRGENPGRVSHRLGALHHSCAFSTMPMQARPPEQPQRRTEHGCSCPTIRPFQLVTCSCRISVLEEGTLM